MEVTFNEASYVSASEYDALKINLKKSKYIVDEITDEPVDDSVVVMKIPP